MLPKNSKHFIYPTSEKLGCDQQLIEDVVGFYYSTLRKALSNLDCHYIQVENLGLFKAKPIELPKLINKYENHLNILQPETFNQMAIKKDLEMRLERVRNLQKLISEDQERRTNFLKQKYGK
jgi:predicted RNase H-like nuclease (RuvC/YqgF family)